MVNIQNKKIKGEVNAVRFLSVNIIIPILIPFILTMIIVKFLPQNLIIKIVDSRIGVEGLVSAIKVIPWVLKVLEAVIIFSFLFLFYVKSIFSRFCPELLPSNKYFLVPTWMIKFAVFVRWSDKNVNGSAKSIPTWQYMDYLYNNWNRVKLSIPEVCNVDENTSVIVEKPSKHGKILSIIISDTYPIIIEKLPSFIKNHNYALIQTMVNGEKNKGQRGYNTKLVQECISLIKEGMNNGVTTINILANTNPKHITEIMRESFEDAGRNPLKHLYVYENPRKNNFYFSKPHKIF
ncbi:hypothetical protein [Limosilactobacillus reuteri]|uniref:hypothetical protein n=1 Tax=Limosilactobacillus reuteri TaxID=1598 RepID=UPI000A2E8CC5|nr:hypothetical protein [Limosilactobacillus reuteri]OTA78365.1 hypothetical protein BHL80_05840 [Limosilactobacillus reuteri]OTA88188.1 hypothetical protein BHL84_05625 [Limosilactobacillus reuteri]